MAPSQASPFDDSAIDAARPMRVVVVGLGYSGIIAGIRFLQRVRNIQLTIYEASAGIGGTWFSNKYPGLACDIPSHCYQLTFHEKTDWSSFYATGPVDKYNLHPFIKLEHRLTSAVYSEDTGKWNLTIQRGSDPDRLEQFEDTADVLFTGMGGLSRWKWPDIKGLHSFGGKIIHSAKWETGEGDRDSPWEDTVRSWKEKRVGIIGVGSSAIQIVPALQPKVTHLVNYVRGKTWISSPFLGDRAEKLGMGKLESNCKTSCLFYGGSETDQYADMFTKKDKEEFKDPAFYKKFRRELESELNSIHVVTLKGSAVQEGGRAAFKADMLQRLATKPLIAEHLIPDFAVGCRRLTPGPGYLEALCQDNVEFTPTEIKQVLPNGIERVDGTIDELDVIVCATGFDTSYQLGFPIVGRGGVQLSDKYKPHPKLYVSVAVDGFPNWFQALGPNAAVGSGWVRSFCLEFSFIAHLFRSLLILIERQVEYAVEATLKLQREHLKSMDVKAEAMEDWDVYLEHHFAKTIFSERCRSWYKQGKEEGRVVALWPGSCLHAVRALEHPRWEDYNYEPLDGHTNRFFWAGNGMTVAEETPGADRAWYLSEVDVPPALCPTLSNSIPDL
ncbi:FAD/NAD-binding domain-containing protein [Mycena maculata]|uniref:FAD/NAD-binding domain-containing protein n=1 Tax=Mycena maculata TaxID=230809 RepID=A0AAD7J3C3_9AGAR|nr:FAD/NAD-binding domain-containing protein [Mycena maculata]